MKLALKVPPPVVTLIAGAAMWLVAWALPWLGLALPAKLAVALALAAAGVAVPIAAVVSFVRAKTTVSPLKPESTSALVTSGMYRYSRNPMYLGMALVLLAWGVYLANLAALAFLPLFTLYMNRYQIEPEERALSNRFGDVYKAYSARVRRWL
jgi:protein-S-isoprenylcysteine O-methyltransferase Ste14